MYRESTIKLPGDICNFRPHEGDAYNREGEALFQS